MKSQPSLRLQIPPRSVGGSALIITLAVLVLMSIMVISLSDIMRIERGSAHTHLEKARAELMAEMGTATVVARLRKETTDTSRNWISEPGQIVASASNDPAAPNPNLSKQVIDPPIPLSSGIPDQVTFTSVPAYLRPAQLNVPTFDTVTTGSIPPHVISNQEDPARPGNAVSMGVRWIYVRKDGTEDLSEQPSLSDPANPIVGRYGYWTDDESCKVNYNLAWKRSSANPNQAGHPTKINLPTLLGVSDPDAEAKADAIHFYDPNATNPPSLPASITDYQMINRFFFHTPEDARQVARLHAGVDTALLAAKFNVTHYNHDPDTTFFNEPRIVLTTQPERAGWKYDNNSSQWVGTNGKPWPDGLPVFINVGKVDPTSPTKHPYTNMWDPIAHVDPTKLADVVDKLNSYLQRKDWPIAPSGWTMQAKYYAGNANRLTQLSLNIINYVRTKESAGDPPANTDPSKITSTDTKTVIPVRGEQIPGQRFVMMPVATSPDSYIGITRTPKITEMGLYVSSTTSSVNASTNTYSYPAKAKIEIYLPPNFGLSKIDLTKLSFYASWAAVSGGAKIQNNSNEAVIKGGASGEVLVPARNDKSGELRAGEYAIVTRPLTVSFTGARPTASADIGLRYAISIVHRLDVCPLGDPAVCTLDPPPPTVLEADISSIEVDDPRVNSYKGDWKKVTKNSFGAPNLKTLTVGKPPGAYFPKQDLGKNGLITDISFFMPAPAGSSANPTGVVASAGELGFIHTGMESTAKAGVPWRTLHLQPDRTQALPDWAFMDLFTVPADVPPDVAGKPSPKAIYSPHNTTTAGRVNMNAKPEPFDLDRQDPLVAVFEGASYDATNPTLTLSNTQAKTIADAVYHRTLAASGKQYGYPNGYDSPGEIVEIAGVADGGEESEQLVREVANLITARGGVFSVYTVGQALKQTPTGTLIVTGEQRQQATIERYSDTTGVHFRPVFFRSLTP